METLKKHLHKFLLATGAFFAVAFFFLRIFKSSSQSSADKLAESLLSAEKKRLNEEKKQLEQKSKDVEKKVYSDEEIEKKYNS